MTFGRHRRLALLAGAVAAAVGLATAPAAGAAPTPGSDAQSTAPAPRPGEPAAARAATAAELRPRLVDRLIPFGERRKRQTARYSLRHYGEREHRLRHPRVVVEHYTDGPTMLSAWWTMANNTPNLGERPGVCAHFIVDTDGRVYRTVPLRLRCRHTIGLNQTAIGIEHVGTSDRGVMGNRAQRRASLRLTLWLMARYAIPARNVVGHGESLITPLRSEAYPAWQCLTHTDFSHATMRDYRLRLRALAQDAGVPAGGRPRWVDSGC